MTGSFKGGVLGAAAMLVVIVLWTLAAGQGHGPACPGYRCECSPVPAKAFFLIGLIVGMPWAILVGAALGWTATRLIHHRQVVLLIIVAILATVLTALAGLVTDCAIDPSAGALWWRAVVPLAAAAMTLELWTRPLEAVPRATALG